MTEYVQIRIASDGDPLHTEVIVDGKHISGVTSIRWEATPDTLPKAVIEVIAVPIYAESTLEETVIQCPICKVYFPHHCPTKSPEPPSP